MDPEMGKAAFRIAVCLIFGALLLLPFNPPGSAEFYVSIFTLIIGFAFLGLVFLLLRMFK